MPRRIRDLVLAVIGLTLLLAALATVDDRVPGQMLGMARDVSHGHVEAPGPVADLALKVSGSLAMDDMFLIAMVGAGVVLVILMVRT
jgi:hypothetical protein